MIILIIVFITAAILLLGWVISDALASKRRRIHRLLEAGRPASTKRKKFSLAVFPFTRKILDRLGLEVKIKNRLDAAHVKLAADEFFNIKIILMAALSIIAGVAFGVSSPAIILVGLALGYIIPDIYLHKKLAARKHSIARILPETVDLLGLCVEAGLDFTTAVKWIIEKTTSNPMVEELAFVLEEIKWGKPRVQALKDMAKRLNVFEVSSFVQTLVQSERMGTPVSEAFAILSEDARLQRFHRGERIAMQAPIKILIPLIFCILPVIGIIIGGPIFLQFMQGNLLKGFGG